MSILSGFFQTFFGIIIVEQLMDLFSQIFNDVLCAYRKTFGCEDVLFKVIDLWKNVLDSNNFAHTILINLSKAFDCVPHGFLITMVFQIMLADLYPVI